MLNAVCYLSQNGGTRVCEYMHAGAIYNDIVLTQGRTEQKGGTKTQPPGKSHAGLTAWRTNTGNLRKRNNIQFNS